MSPEGMHRECDVLGRTGHIRFAILRELRLYFASPLFSSPERSWNAEVAAAHPAAGPQVLQPQEQEPHVSRTIRGLQPDADRGCDDPARSPEVDTGRGGRNDHRGSRAPRDDLACQADERNRQSDCRSALIRLAAHRRLAVSDAASALSQAARPSAVPVEITFSTCSTNKLNASLPS